MICQPELYKAKKSKFAAFPQISPTRVAAREAPPAPTYISLYSSCSPLLYISSPD